jgi:ketosteroid isomerase-like protein
MQPETAAKVKYGVWERDIMQCDDRGFKAMVRGDVAALRMGLSDHLTYTHTSGVHDTKAQFLGSLTLGQLSYKSIIPEARSVRVYGGTGIVTGTARMEITARGQDARFRIRYLAVYVKAQDRWQLVAWQSTRVPDAYAESPEDSGPPPHS